MYIPLTTGAATAIGTVTTTGTLNLKPCPHCGNAHAGNCQRIKAIEYYRDGSIKRVEYHAPVDAVSVSSVWTKDPLQPPYEITCGDSIQSINIPGSATWVTGTSAKVPTTLTGSCVTK